MVQGPALALGVGRRLLPGPGVPLLLGGMVQLQLVLVPGRDTEVMNVTFLASTWSVQCLSWGEQDFACSSWSTRTPRPWAMRGKVSTMFFSMFSNSWTGYSAFSVLDSPAGGPA